MMDWSRHDFLGRIAALAAEIPSAPEIYIHCGAEFQLNGIFDEPPQLLKAGKDWDDGLGDQPNLDGALPELLFGTVAGVPVMAAMHCRSYAEGGGIRPVIFPDALAYRLGARKFIYIDAGISLDAELKPGKWAMLTDFISSYGFSPLDGLHPYLPVPFPNLGSALSQFLNSEIINAIAESEPVPMLCSCCGIPGFQQLSPAAADKARNDGAAVVAADLVLHLPFACALGCDASAMILAVSQMLPGYYPAAVREDYTETCRFFSPHLRRALKKAIPEI
ncbi:MAG: hypothetical protein J6S21_03790 [Victivallales bacterium]|nr:hypothetical protein [Victivallales bacterium]